MRGEEQAKGVRREKSFYSLLRRHVLYPPSEPYWRIETLRPVSVLTSSSLRSQSEQRSDDAYVF